jgi:hypothetical protein
MNFGFPAAILTGIIPLDSTYIASGIIADSVHPHLAGHIFLKFDLNGEIIDAKTLTSANQTYEAWFNPMVKLPDGSYIVAGESSDTVRQASLMKFTSDGDTIFIKRYKNPLYPTQEFIQTRAFTTMPDGGFAIGCWIRVGIVNGFVNNGIYVIRTDSIGNILWDKILGNNLSEFPMSMVVDESGNLIIGGLKRNNNLVTQNYTFQTYLTQLDSLGNIQWSYLTPTSIGLRDAANDMILLEDGSLVIASGVGWEQERPSINVVWFDKYIFKLSPNHEIEWELTFDTPEITGLITTSALIKVSDESGYVLAGTEYEQINPPVNFTIRGWIGKISPEGDSVWTRRYAYLTDTPNEHKIYDLKETPDGGLIICGESKDWGDGATYPQQAWLLKLDQYGCLVPGCHLIDATEETKPEIKLAIYPNPASDYLNFYLRTPVPVREASFRIVNAAGAVVREFRNDMPGATYMVPVWEWAAGIYFLQYLENGLVRCSEQFVKH